MKESQKTSSKLIKTRKEMAELLEFVDKTLDQVPFAVAPSVIDALNFSTLMGRNNRLGLMGKDESNQGLRSISSVGNDKLVAQAIQQRFGLGDIVAFTAGQQKTQRITQTVYKDVNFRAESASAAPERLFSLPPFFYPHPQQQDGHE